MKLMAVSTIYIFVTGGSNQASHVFPKFQLKNTQFLVKYIYSNFDIEQIVYAPKK